jgi:hypothetical protein
MQGASAHATPHLLFSQDMAWFAFFCTAGFNAPIASSGHGRFCENSNIIQACFYETSTISNEPVNLGPIEAGNR